MSRVSYVIIVATLAICSLCAGCQGKDTAEGKPTIAVSIEPLRNVVEAIAGDDYEVVTVLDRGADPELFEPSMSTRVGLDKSDAYFILNVFPFEQSIVSSLSDAVAVVDLSQGIERLVGTHEHHHDADGDEVHAHGEADPHIWSSVVNMKVIADNAAEALAALNPDRKEIYSQRLDSLTAAADSLDAYIKGRLQTADVKAFAIWHPSLSYFARDYDLQQIAVGNEGKDMSPRGLNDAVRRAVDAGAEVFMMQREYDSRQASTIGKQIGARMITIDALDADWSNQLKLIADELAK